MAGEGDSPSKPQYVSIVEGTVNLTADAVSLKDTADNDIDPATDTRLKIGSAPAPGERKLVEVPDDVATSGGTIYVGWNASISATEGAATWWVRRLVFTKPGTTLTIDDQTLENVNWDDRATHGWTS